MTAHGIAGILVDLDETLHSREAAFWSWIESEANAAGGAEHLDRERIATLDQRGRGDKQALFEYLDTALGWNESHAQRLARFRAGIASFVRPDPGVRELLERLIGRYRLGLVSNGASRTQRRTLARLQITHLFEPVVISEEVGFRKPDARIFEFALAKWPIPRESVLFVGDDPTADIQGARAVGMRALRVGADDGIASFTMLESWLERHD